MLDPLRRLLLVALAALSACDPGDAGEGADPDADQAMSELDDGSGAGSGEPNDGGEGDGAAPVLLPECGLEPACEVLSLPIDEAATQQRYDADGLCVFTALSAPTAATLLQIEVSYASSTSNLDLAFVDAETVLRQSYGRGDDVGEWINPPMRCALRGPEFFVACAASYDPACLDPESWVSGCEPVEALVCPAP